MFLKRKVPPLALLLIGVAGYVAGQDPAFHFRFDRTIEQKMVKDLTGKVECYSPQGIFQAERGGLRVAEGSQFQIPHQQLPPLTDHFTFNVWYYGSSRGLHNTLFFKGHYPKDVQFDCYVQDRFPALFGMVEKRWEGIYTSGYGHLTSYPMKNIIMDTQAYEVMPGKWNMLTFVFQNSVAEIYVNGKLSLRRKSGNWKALSPGTEPLWIGSSREKGKKLNKADSDMIINDIRLYDDALSAEKIAALYDQEKGRYAKWPVQESWEKLPPCHVYMARLIPGYDPDYQVRLPKTAAYLKTLRKPVFTGKPTVSKIVMDNGSMKISINGKLYAPLIYSTGVNMTLVKDFGSRYEDFAAAGFKLYGGSPGSWRDIPHIWKGDGDYDFSLMDQLIRKLIELNPSGRIQVALHPEPNHWFQKAHKRDLELYYATGKSNDELKIYYTGHPGSDVWIGCVSRMLEAMVRHIEAQDYAEKVYDYKIFMSGGGEWYWPGCFTGGVSGYSDSTRDTFRAWLKAKYKSDAALQKAWNDASVTLSTAKVPSPEFRFSSEHFNFRDPVKARPCYDFRDYMNDRTILSISTITAALKRGCSGQKTVTTYYGYPIHYSSCANPTQFTSAVFTLGRVLRLNTVDHIATPITYNRRQVGEAGVNINPFGGSAALHGKMVWHENDLRTHLFPQEVHGRPSNLQESCMQIRRGVTLASAMGMGCWFLGLPSYCYHESRIMDEMADLQKQMDLAMQQNTATAAEVALIFDEASMRHTGFNKSTFLGAHIRDFHDDLFHAGAPFDAYLLDDIGDPKMRDYKLYLFVNVFEFTPEKMQLIQKKLGRNKAVAFWSYAPGLINGNGFSTETMRKLTGISFGYEDSPRSVSLSLNGKTHPLNRYPGKNKSYPVGPFVYVDDPEAEVLGTAGGKPALAVKKCPSWTSVYSLMPLNRKLLAGLYEFAGVHRYLKSEDVFFANQSYLMLHASAPGDKTFYLKKPSDVVEVFTGKSFDRGITSFTDSDIPFGTTRFYLVKETEKRSK